MDKETRNKIMAEIQASTIPEELKALYLMADSTETMSAQIFERIKAVYAKHGYNTNENELLTGINDYCKSIKKAQFHFAQRIEPQISGATFDIGGSTQYDDFHGWSNTIIRLVLKFLNACAGGKEAYPKVFTLLSKLPGGNLYKPEDFSKYKMK